MPDRNFNGRVVDAAEAIALVRGRDAARAQAAMLTQEGRWSSFTRDRFGAGAMIDYARSEAGHMAYLAYAGPHETDWSYARARYAVNCEARTAFVEYFVTYNYRDEIVAISGPSRQMPIGVTSAQAALASFCTASTPDGRSHHTLDDALAQIRREMTPH